MVESLESPEGLHPCLDAVREASHVRLEQHLYYVEIRLCRCAFHRPSVSNVQGAVYFTPCRTEISRNEYDPTPPEKKTESQLEIVAQSLNWCSREPLNQNAACDPPSYVMAKCPQAFSTRLIETNSWPKFPVLESHFNLLEPPPGQPPFNTRSVSGGSLSISLLLVIVQYTFVSTETALH